jgi:hypothetical protein
MKQDEIIEMAEQAGYLDLSPINRGMELKELIAFAKLVTAKSTQAEKERCAKIARLCHNHRYGNFPSKKSTESDPNYVALEIESAILAEENKIEA